MSVRPQLKKHNVAYLRKLSDFDIYVVRYENHAPIIRHNHMFYEVVFIESGSADHVSKAGVQKLHPGDVIIMRPRMWHAYQNSRVGFDGKQDFLHPNIARR